MSSLVEIDNRGIPPLAGICGYEEAARPGLTVDETVVRLKRYNYVLRRLQEIGAAHLPSAPDWEVKCAFSLHMWLDSEHASAIRARIAEMREPPLHLDDVADERLEAPFEEPIAASALSEPRWDGLPYEMDAEPRRDDRFLDPFNVTARIDEYAADESLPADERTWALAYKRLREMDVPEMMAPIIYKTRGKPWAYYHDLARQLWDEARHAMMGEVSLVSLGIPFYAYPILITFSTTLNLECTPLEAH